MFSCSGHVYSFLCPQQPGSKYCLYRHNHFQGSWSPIVSLPGSLFNFGIATLDLKLLVVGGSSDLSGTLYSKEVYSLDLSSLDPSWTRLVDLPHGCCIPQVIVQGSQVHVLGYCHSDSDEDCRVLTLDLSIADANHCWLHNVIPPVPRRRCYGALTNGCLVVLANCEKMPYIVHVCSRVPKVSRSSGTRNLQKSMAMLLSFAWHHTVRT